LNNVYLRGVSDEETTECVKGLAGTDIGD
jgi:hypothetical protein